MVEDQHCVFFEAKGLTDKERIKVRRYFQTKRVSGGGECGLVEYIGLDTYRISFMEKDAQERVLGRPGHSISLPRGDLTLSLFISGDRKKKVFTLPTHLLRYLRDSPKASTVLLTKLSLMGCSVQLMPDSGKAMVWGELHNAPGNPPGGSGAPDMWERQLDWLFTSLQNIYRCYHESHPEKLKVLIENPSLETEDLRVYREGGGSAVIVGEVGEVEERIKMMEEKRLIEMECPAPQSLYSLVEEAFKLEMNAHFPEVRLCRNGSNCVVLMGPNKNVQQGSEKLDRLIKIIRGKNICFPKVLLCLLKSSGAILKYQARFQQNLCSPVTLEAHSDLALYSLSSEALEEAAVTVQRDLGAEILQLEGSMALSPPLDELKEALSKAKSQANQEDFRVEVIFHPEPSGSSKATVQLVGYSEELDTLKRLISDYKFNQREVKVNVPLPLSEMVDYFDKILALIGMKPPGVKLTASHSPSRSVLLSGPRCLVQEAREALSTALACLTWEKLVLDGPGACHYFRGEGKRSVEQLESSCQVLIREQKQEDGQRNSAAGTRVKEDAAVPGAVTGGPSGRLSSLTSCFDPFHALALTSAQNINLEVTSGNLEEQQADVLVVPMVNTELTSTAIGNCVVAKAGSIMKTYFELSAGGRKLAPGEVLQITGTPALGSSKVLFIECLPWDAANGRSAKALQTGLSSALDHCGQQGWCSVAVPVIGPGAVLNFPEKEAVEILTEQISQFGQTGFTGALSTIRVAIKNDSALMQRVHTILSSDRMKWRGSVSLSSNPKMSLNTPPLPVRLQPISPAFNNLTDLSSLLSSTSSSAAPSVFLIWGLSKKEVAQAAKKLSLIYQRKCCQYNISAKDLAGVTQKDVGELGNQVATLGLCLMRDQALAVPGGHAGLDGWTVSGLKDRVHQVVHLISRFGSQQKEETRKGEEEVTYSRVTWCVLRTTGNWERFPKAANYLLEKRDVGGGVVEGNGTWWSVDLSKMEATDQGTGQVAKLKRLESLPDVPLPLYWDNMADGEQLKIVPLSDTSEEYRKVKDEFNKTACKKVEKIERVQNLHLRRAYEVHKKYMIEKNQSQSVVVERLLYHGTTYDCCQSIMNNGYNRRFAGANGTLFGKGTYFAVDASYSIGYAPQGPSGSHLMFAGRVLTGTYTQGDSTMRVPPARPSQQPSDRYDSVVNDVQNPSMFVVFNDSAAYPDYLITFR